MTINLRTGRTVVIDELHQWLTYAGLLAGWPNADMNQRRIEALLKNARSFGVVGADPYLVSAPVTVKEWDRGGTIERSESLPAICCIAVLTSGELARPDSEPYSSLTVVWFQDQLAMPIAPDAENLIRDIDWEGAAMDWCW